MKNLTKNNNLSFYKVDVVEVLENLAKRTAEPLNKFSYWVLAQSLKNKWLSPFLMDYLILIERERHARKKAEFLNELSEEQGRSDESSSKVKVQSTTTSDLTSKEQKAKKEKTNKTYPDDLIR